MYPRVSVITVCFNAEKELEQTITSIVNQTFRDYEYIIIDGGSTDNTINIIEKYNKKINYWISEKDNGIFDAMNKALKIAHGEWTIFMNAGDKFVDTTTLAKVFSLKRSPNTGIIFGKTLCNKGIMKMTPFVYKKTSYRNMGICHQSIFVRSDLAKKYQFDCNFKLTADYNMIMSIYKAGYQFLDTKFPIAYFDLNGYSSKHAIQQIKETAIICKAKNTLGYYKALYSYIIKNIIKQIMRRI